MTQLPPVDAKEYIMRASVSIVIRSFIILIAASAIGLGLNLASGKPLPWIYEPPKELTLEGVKIPLINEKEAREFFDDPNTVFVDTRNKEDYSDGHIEGAVFLPAHEKEEQFQSVEPLLDEDSRLVLYCHGPECEMAEQVAVFLIQLGYKNLVILTSGYQIWEKAGYPVSKP
jgi:rhodanese-related sulfurtransferase